MIETYPIQYRPKIDTIFLAVACITEYIGLHAPIQRQDMLVTKVFVIKIKTQKRVELILYYQNRS